jgi:protein arginine N-methyltransferase 1
MYSVHDYGLMIADRVRMEAYSHALRLAVRPGSAVLDLGAGAGIFSLLACRFGARRVYAIEPESIIQVGREIAAANGYGERIVFLPQRAEQVELPERVDVIVSDLRGALPCFADHLPVLVDARQRFLASRGAMIGKRDTVWAAVVEAPEMYRHHFAGWDEAALGFDQQAARCIVANNWSNGRFLPEQLLVEPCCLATFDYETIAGPDLSATASWTMARPGTAHGLVVWFDAVLAEGVGFSNAPGQPEMIYSNVFCPWPEPVDLDAGDQVKVTFEARFVGRDYVWRWDSSISGPQEVRAGFQQTSFLGGPVSPATLRRLALQHRAVLGEDGQIDRFILSAMNGRASLGTIARRVLARFPGRFANLKAAMSRVGELSVRYSR